MVDEYADILGAEGVPIVHETRSSGWFGLFFTIKSAFTLALLLVGYVVCARFWKSILKWQERSYRLSMRRKHGIPDNDHRPFNVAYAAVLRGRQEQEAASRNKRIVEQPAPSRDQHNTPTKQNNKYNLASQLNVDSDWPAGPVSSIPGRFTSTSVDHPLPSTNQLHRSSLTTAQTDRYNPSHKASNYSPPRAGPSRRLSRKSLVPLVNNPQFAVDDDDNDEPSDTKVSGDEIDGDEGQEWYIPKRGAKRVLGDEEENDDVYQTKKIREKRARKVSLEKNPQVVILDDDMEIDEEDDNLPELKSISRGKKRDRAEAGSTFGGDDEDSAPEVEHEDDAKAERRRRKRRTVAKRKSDIGGSVRGQKRDRGVSGEDSEGESDGGAHAHISRKKRGRKSKHSTARDDEEQRRNGSDISMDDSQASTRSKNRRVGDEWESNGTKYKIGPNYQRLQQALVKKARQKFTMPQDSQHPDRSANLEVFVECWLTDEEYKNAKAQHLLAWQDSPKQSAEPETLAVVVPVSEPPSPQVGKNLLWSSTSTPSLGHSPLNESTFGSQPRQLMARNPYRQSIATSVGLRMNPFEQPHQSRRISSAPRIASSYSGSGSPGLVDTTNGSPRGAYKTFSKWEKQDLEAKSMMKMREANKRKEEEKAAKAQKEKEEKERTEREQREREQAAAAACAPPVMSFPKPVETKVEQAEGKQPGFSFGPPPNAAANPPTLPSITVTPPSQAPAKAPEGTSAPAPPTHLQQQNRLATRSSHSDPPRLRPQPNQRQTCLVHLLLPLRLRNLSPQSRQAGSLSPACACRCQRGKQTRGIKAGIFIPRTDHRRGPCH
ncbi:hypothetical protein BD779DRAFT_408507 [Infundibulicybe gibba]|nr:hypothetical protein BD779DRAFT_408507 [Infundibulicybe gibba]